MLLELSAFPQIPGADRVIEASGPQFGPVVGDVDTAGSIRVALELPGTTRCQKLDRNKESFPCRCLMLTVGCFAKCSEQCLK